MTRTLLALMITSIAAALAAGCGSSIAEVEGFTLAPGDSTTIRIDGKKVKTVVRNTGDANLHLEGVHPDGGTWQQETVIFAGTTFKTTTDRDVHVMISNASGMPGSFSIESKGGGDMVLEVDGE